MNGSHGDSEGHRIVGRTSRGRKDAEDEFHFFRCQCIGWDANGHTDIGGLFVAVTGADRDRRSVQLNGPAGGSDGGGNTEVVLAVPLVGDGQRGGFVAARFNVGEHGVGNGDAGASRLADDDAKVSLALDGPVVAVFSDDLNDGFRSRGHRIIR